MSRLDRRVAVVTGSATGIGAATAVRLAADGASVVLADVNEQGAQQTVDAITRAGGTAVYLRTDVSDETSVANTFAATEERFGRVDILHNNAAAISPEVQGRDEAIADGDVDVWDRTYAVNLRGVMLGCKHAIPRMLARGGGVIVNTSSTSALQGGPRSVAYAASKAGVIAVTQHVASRYGKEGIRCVAIAPGLIVTDHVEQKVPQAWRAVMHRQQCTEHVGRPDDIANAVSFLVSDEAAFITGVLIPVDGGQTCHRATLADELEGISQVPA